MADADENPFRLPPDDQIFLMREIERNQRAEDREKVKRLKVHEKTTASSRIHRIRRLQDDDAPAPVSEPNTARGRTGRSVDTIGRDPRREKENITDFVEKKKEMFLVQMSLDVKKAEILKLDEKAKMKDDALKKSQAMLDEDVTRFDTFLQANDAKAHKAMKQAEDMTKKKQEKMQRIKQLKSQISVIQSEISKHKEQKEECIKFKTFLEKLTPIEWKEKQDQLKQERKQRRKQQWIAKKMEEIEHKIHNEIEAEERAQAEKEESQKTRRKKREEEEYQREKEREAERRRHRIRRRYPTADAIEKEYQGVSSGEEMPLYFQEPKQLLDIFTALEESNLFLIQNSQETEQALEEVEQKFEETKRIMGSKANKMKQQIAQLEKQIADEKAKCEELRHTVSQKRGASEQDQLLKELDASVLEVHTACGFDHDHDPNTLQMLGAIEAKLEELLTQLDEAEATNKDQLDALERSKEKERRERVRHQRKENSDRKIEERLKASLLRSQAPVHKKIGKQIMFRSAPLFQARKVVKEDDGFEDAERDHNVFGIWIAKDGIPNATQPVRPS
eukprot:gnl/MRDRNA2_/MRDRNA2_87199_c0_seq1.p1 gnl/MRDRNA2_/MRDRNA2_87199_c0~~gnl/MRDRNA2_/MRDRNA2_87199_c0_seq1.p1  ORF type:complete len:562 (+),score=196.72 gnl/MRDRNA2_/MRDRNA2_87199_c0_seq1:100-1785(+)